METGAIVKTAFCGPCFGAGDTPANNAFSIRHSTRNFPNREGSKLQNGQIASVALMDARSIAATAANKGYPDRSNRYGCRITRNRNTIFDKKIYANRVFDSKGVADPDVEIQFGPNIKDWPAMSRTSGESGIESCFRDSRSGYDNRRADPVRRDILLSVPIHLDWQSLHFPEKILLMSDVQKRSRKHRKRLKQANVRLKLYRKMKAGYG